ncbi:RagB/SusD family nutrient uptake outer membrane protein [Pedobacter sp. L105]|uniref:RagB/SusD family nutrient uptake outer membrane protein n=1 Tax=Pedobacter sp. L105 TaxID=1641871 RepID=UPI00131B36EE|nr:RagB/SusD family nutrient uptake outer membrane protein [Pedobacter sp. L105]
MKKYLFLLLLTSLWACKKDFLNLTPDTSLSSASFFKDKGQFNQALIAAYVPLRTLVHTAIYMDEMRSDNAFFTRYGANRGLETSTESLAEFLDDANSSAQQNSPGNRYGNDYSGIAMTNTILTRIAGVDFAASAKDSISGEALFLRAYYYFDLVQHYGGVPLQLDEITAAAQAFKPRNTSEEVYAQIVKDLTSAIPKLPVVTSFPQSGRASKGAAKMLLAYTYMSQAAKNYAGAETELMDITRMNYSLLPDYASVFDPNNKNSSESIFEVQYMADLVSGQQSNFAWIMIPKTLNSEVLTGYHGSTMNIFSGWDVPTQEMVDSYETGDKRLSASIGVVEGKISGVEDFTAIDIKSPVNFTPVAGQTNIYMVKKYFHPPYTVEFNTPDDWPIFRYSGALLLLSECLVQEGKSGQALIYLNQVRQRAGLAPLAEATMDDIANETRHELAFENHRWTDLIRIGKAIDVSNAKGVRLKALYGWLIPASFNVNANKLIFPIPARELQINTLLTQNPGY